MALTGTQKFLTGGAQIIRPKSKYATQIINLLLNTKFFRKPYKKAQGKISVLNKNLSGITLGRKMSGANDFCNGSTTFEMNHGDPLTSVDESSLSMQVSTNGCVTGQHTIY
jgi:hypothetical protein